MGAGFIISRRGYILTNLHVVAGADEIRVRLMDEREFLGELIEADEKSDLAVVKIPSRSDLPVIPLGDSDQAEVGDRVLAIGNPLGLDQTVTAGVISAVGRSDLGLTSQESFIQTDAMMSFGNSGGPLLNLKGEVIGIDTAVVAAGHGIGFAVPVNIARWMAGPLLADLSGPPVWMGIMARTATPQEAQDAGRLTGNGGVWVESVIPESPATSAGLKSKDLIIKIDSVPVTDVWQLRQWIDDNRVKSRSTIDLIRGKKEEHLTVVFAERPSKLEIERTVEYNGTNFP
jgi:S1-C subfamily serine protease